MQHYTAKEVICPFYKKEEQLRLYCEGFCPTCHLQITFTGLRHMYTHKAKHCNSFKGYPQCPLYPAINGQYETAKQP